MRKNSLLSGKQWTLLLACACFLLPAEAAYAGAGGVCPGSGFTYRLVSCIQTALFGVVTGFVGNFFAALSNAILAAMTLAVILFGYLTVSGKAQAVSREAIILALKIGGIVYYMSEFPNIFTMLITLLDSLINIVVGYTTYSTSTQCPTYTLSGSGTWIPVSIWLRIDCALTLLIGDFISGNSLSGGIIGFIVLSLFSGPFGMALFLMGVAFVLIMALTVAKAMYIFISAIIAIAVLMCVSPLIVPLILFRSTKDRFEKWLRLLIGIMIQPIALFAYLGMLLVTFDVTIFSGPNSVYRALACARVDAPGFTIGGFVGSSGAVQERTEENAISNFRLNVEPKELMGGLTALQDVDALEQTGTWGEMGQWLEEKYGGINDALNRWVDVPTMAINFNTMHALCMSSGASYGSITLLQYIINALLALFTAVVVGYILYTMMDFIPYLGQSLGGELLSMPNLGGGFGQMQKSVTEGIQGLGNKLGLKGSGKAPPPPPNVGRR